MINREDTEAVRELVIDVLTGLDADGYASTVSTTTGEGGITTTTPIPIEQRTESPWEPTPLTIEELVPEDYTDPFAIVEPAPFQEEVEIDITLPEISDTITIKDNTSRFSSAEWFKIIQEQQITLAGVGGIGSWVAALLGRLDVGSITLWDDDVVDASNLSGQLYRTEDVGISKVESCASLLRDFSQYYKVSSIDSKFTKDSPVTDVMICGFDNMAARNTFYEAWVDHILKFDADKRQRCLFIDGRLAAEEFQVFCIGGNDHFYRSEYKSKWLFTDDQADETLCSYKQTSHIANMIASTMCTLFTNYFANYLGAFREVPFLTEFSASSMDFKVIK